MPIFIKQKKNTLTNGVVVRPYSKDCILVKAEGPLGEIICYDDNKRRTRLTT